MSIIIDDPNFPSFDYTGTQWTHERGQGQAYNGTLTVCNTAVQTSAFSLPPSLIMSFYGTDVFVYGTLTDQVAMNYTIDGTTLRPAVFSSKADINKPGNAIWSLTGLSTTAYHTLKLFPIAGQLTIDYLTSTPTSFTNLVAADIILDDQNPGLKYSSGWKATNNTAFNTGIPYMRTTTGTSTKGSTMKFTFVGSSVSVYGALQQVDGKLSASFSVDGAAATVFTPFNGSQSSTSAWLVSQQFFRQDFAPGTHSLLVSLDDISGSQTLWLDYVIFEGTSGTKLASIGTGTTSAGVPGTTSSTGLVPVNSSNGFHFPIPAIGGIVGGLVVLVFFLGLWRWRYRRTPIYDAPLQTTHTTYLTSAATTTNLYGMASTPAPRPPPMEPVQRVPHNDLSGLSLYNNDSTIGSPWRGQNPPISPDPYIPRPISRPAEPPAPSPQARQDGYQPPIRMPEPSSPPFRPPPQSLASETSSQWESASSYVSSNPSSSAGLLSSNEKGFTTLQWQPQWPTVRNPSPQADGWNPPQAIPSQVRELDGRSPQAMPRPADEQDGHTPAPQLDGSNAAPAQQLNNVSHAHEDGRDDDPPAVREIDAGPINTLPPAYNDNLYGPV